MSKPYAGREAVATIRRTVFLVLEDSDTSTSSVAMASKPRVGDRSLQGIDLLRPDANGQIVEFTVMITDRLPA